MYPVKIDGEWIALREFTADDVDALLPIYGDPEATRHMSFEPQTREQVAQFPANAARQAQETPRLEYALAVALTRTGDLIGSARLALGEHRSGQIGFALRVDQWGQGLGTETARLLLELGFRRLGLHRIWAARAPDNVSARVLWKVGMVPEGRIRDHVFVRGAWRDSVTYSILEDEWRSPAPGLSLSP